MRALSTFLVWAFLATPAAANTECSRPMIALTASGGPVIGDGNRNLFLLPPDRARIQTTTGTGDSVTLDYLFRTGHNLIRLTPMPDTPAPALVLYSVANGMFYCPECYRIRLPAYWHLFTLSEPALGCPEQDAVNADAAA